MIVHSLLCITTAPITNVHGTISVARLVLPTHRQSLKSAQMIVQRKVKFVLSVNFLLSIWEKITANVQLTIGGAKAMIMI